MGGTVTPSSQYNNTESEWQFRQRVFNLFTAVNGNLGFSNLAGQFYPGALNGLPTDVVSAAANVEFAIAHTLGRVPTFYWAISKSGGVLYQRNGDGTAWTATNIYVKSTVSSEHYTVYII